MQERCRFAGWWQVAVLRIRRPWKGISCDDPVCPPARWFAGNWRSCCSAGESAQQQQHHLMQATAAATAASPDVAAQRATLLAKLWVPANAATAGQLADDSAAACQLALQAAPPAELAAVSLRCNASVIAAASNALADAAS